MQFDLNRDGLVGPFDINEDTLINNFVRLLDTGIEKKNIHARSPLCQRIMSSNALVEKIEESVGSNLLTWRTNCFQKSNGTEEIRWHHDRHFENADMPLNFSNLNNHFSILLALTDMNETSGLMEFVLGSHINDGGAFRDTRPFHKKTIDDHFVSIPDDSLASRIQLPLKKGQFIIFHSGILHRSLASTNSSTRYSFVARFCRENTSIPPQLASTKDIIPYPTPHPEASILRGKVALITGGSSGIGKSIATSLLQEDVHVIITGRDKTKLESTLTELRSFAKKSLITSFAVDAANNEDMTDIFNYVEEEFGGLDIVFINAATNGAVGCIEDISVDEWCDEVARNISSAFITAKLAISSMKSSGGNIILTGSAIGHAGGINNTAYAATKGALRALVLSLAKENQNTKINVNELIPGSVKTSMNRGGLKPPEDISELALVLAKQNLEYGANGQSLSLKDGVA